MTIIELHRERQRYGRQIVRGLPYEPCYLCQWPEQLRAGVCRQCAEKAETDMTWVWEIANPANRWRYFWIDPSRRPPLLELTIVSAWVGLCLGRFMLTIHAAGWEWPIAASLAELGAVLTVFVAVRLANKDRWRKL